MSKLNYKAVGILVAVAAAIYIFGSDNTKKVNPYQEVYDAGPAKERSFLSVVTKAQESAKSAENDMQIGGIKASRDSALCDVIGDRSADGWVGIVSNVTSNSDGKGVLEIEIANNVTLKTWNNDFSDSGYDTLIEQSSQIFEAASSLKEGDVIIFSGSFADGGKECIKEASLSLRGKVLEPEYIFKFSNISKR